MPHNLRAAAPTILLFGGSGEVGFELRRTLAPIGRVVAPARCDAEMLRPDDLCRVIRDVRPEAIVCAAAYTAVEAAQTNQAEAYAVNVVAPRVIADEAAKLGALMVHYSSDYVFDGTKVEPYVEEDCVHPLSVYGETKAAGESAIMDSAARYLILRTSWVFGVLRRNFAKTVLHAARLGQPLKIVVDQVGAPTSAALIADVTAHAILRYLRGANEDFPSGLYHVAAAGATTWHGYACELLRMAADRGLPLKAGAEDVLAISSMAYPAIAARPANSRLNTSRFTHTFGLHMPDWRDGVAHVLDQLSVSW
ncbi:dTDP-4-dehydrorhamnose reductase [Cupriavidus pauculus]|uniref:dTDP-4-dehydrorhamnose reductase n=1 Tax=Cupriavidus pauculus TaxID=82633 RepID=UPI0007829B93|nr:dTDP-4-dehydrorhamnose reductase [Cupriavidus pauculus]MBY4731301.1 dTDP-4-dehydrorhamnose reductase [Cupriavidus pauculus]